jgi:hypothetical protein
MVWEGAEEEKAEVVAFVAERNEWDTRATKVLRLCVYVYVCVCVCVDGVGGR